VACIVTSAACDKIALTAPTDTTITLFANAVTVPLNGSVEITATLVEPAGTPVQNGTLVTFSTNIGTLDPREARTHDGMATVRFNPGGTSGTARITAFSGSARAENIELRVGGAAASRILVNASPSSVPATGGTVEISATVVDDTGNPVGGIAVTFSTNAGTLSSTSIVTDSNGEARTRLTTTRPATVTVSAGAVATPAQLQIGVNAAPSVTIAANPASPTAGQAVQFTFTVNTNATSGAAVRDLVVDFGDGTRQTFQGATGAVNVSHTYDAPGTYTVTATVTDVSGERGVATTVISVQPGTPLSVTLSVQDTATVNTPVSMRATVTGENSASRVVRYEWDFGDGSTAVLNSPATSHIYTTTGRKVVRVTVVTTDGQRLVSQEEIFINTASTTGGA
jgi:PKD repeat protein